jgi:phytoene dehydrogenase-like protein
MTREERFDIVIIGGGPNGVTAAAYLSKCGLSVCVLEEKYESGGSCESAEPIAGARIYPHAQLMYAGPAPGFEQLELHKYGFRMAWSPIDLEKSMGKLGQPTSQGLVPATLVDMMGFGKIAGMLGSPPFMTELMRATFWCPPHPPEVEVTDENVPYMQVYKQHQPDVWTPELRDMTMFDLMDQHMETESLKTMLAFAAWGSGAAGHWEGVAIPAFLAVALLLIPGKLSYPRGGLHAYFHAILRCAIDHGAVIRTCCPVDEIIVSNGRAVGVRLRDNAAVAEKTIWANKAVLSAVDVKQTFQKLIGPQHLSRAFLQKIDDISIKGGSLFVSTFLTRKPIKWLPKFKAMEEVAMGPNKAPFGTTYPADSRELYFENVADVDGYKGNPTLPPEKLMWLLSPSQAFNPADCQHHHPAGYISAPIMQGLTPHQYHVEGPEALDKIKDELNAYVRQAYSQALDGLDDDNVISQWSCTPREMEFRNTGLIGGTWCGRRHCEDQLWTNSPIVGPGMARYRTPIDGLYNCHQSSGHPGGLCLMAIPYNLMHILIEDGIAEPGDWWYPSPWYIPEKGKISAVPRQGRIPE